jgi:hypothetical protein
MEVLERRSAVLAFGKTLDQSHKILATFQISKQGQMFTERKRMIYFVNGQLGFQSFEFREKILRNEDIEPTMRSAVSRLKKRSKALSKFLHLRNRGKVDRVESANLV